MSAWKVLFILVFACTCLALALATIIVPLALGAEDYRWAWFAGLLVATLCMGTLFALYLRKADQTFARDSWRKGR
jgi:hypothetical protein